MASYTQAKNWAPPSWNADLPLSSLNDYLADRGFDYRSADRDALSRGYANASLARVRRISNFAASTRGSPRPP
jgi:hypothetical protein